MVTGEKIRTRSYAELAANINQVKELGRWIVLSEMFGVKKEEQGFIIASHLFITGEPLLQFQSRNSFIMGKQNTPYDVMLADFREAGGSHKIKSKTPDLACIELTMDGETREFSLSWEEAQKEPLPYVGKEDEIVAALANGQKPPLKAKYATPRSRATMLFARVVSDGIRTMAPETNFGHYTPEEIEDYTGNGDVAPKKTNSEPVTQPVSETKQPASETKPTEIGTEPPARNTSAGRISQSTSEPLTAEQRARIVELMKSLVQQGVTDIESTVRSTLKKNGLSALADLSIGAGDSLIAALERKEIFVWAKSQVDGHKGTKSTQ